MFSYIFMKILESRPSRYDKGINILTGGHAKRVKREIVDEWIKPGLEVLDIGCGTGEMLELAVNLRLGVVHDGIGCEGLVHVGEGLFLLLGHPHLERPVVGGVVRQEEPAGELGVDLAEL